MFDNNGCRCTSATEQVEFHLFCDYSIYLGMWAFFSVGRLAKPSFEGGRHHSFFDNGYHSIFYQKYGRHQPRCYRRFCMICNVCYPVQQWVFIIEVVHCYCIVFVLTLRRLLTRVRLTKRCPQKCSKCY